MPSNRWRAMRVSSGQRQRRSGAVEMVMLKVGEIRAMTDGELHGRINEARQELFMLRFQRATGTLSNPMRFRHVRRDLARIMTVLRERELAVELAAAGQLLAEE